MIPALPMSAVEREQSFFEFVRAELAASATRWRDALRLTLLCALGTTIVLAFQLPYGEFLLIFFFAVSQPDAWASLRKARLRGLGTLIGGGLAIFGIAAWSDHPALGLVAQAFLFAVALFFSRTTTIPYVFLLAMFTYVIATPTAATDPDASLEKVLWRIVLTLAGAVIGTVAQLVLWPEHPEKLLLDQLAARLQTAQSILHRVMDGSIRSDQSPAAGERESVAVTMAGQLDLLASAENGSGWLRQRHTEQIKLISDVEMILIAALRLERLAAEDPRMLQDGSVRSKIRATQAGLARIHRALVERCWWPGTHDDSNAAEECGDVTRLEELQPVQLAVKELEEVLQRVPASLAFLPTARTDEWQGSHLLDPIREPIAEKSIFTPACRLSNREVVRFALKGSLAATICYVIFQALNWPAISTCVVTALICAQSSFGAGLRKSLLRLAGAVLGGLAAVATTVVLLPNMENAAAFIVVITILFFGAAWLTVGSSRVSYIGLQVGLVLSLVLLNQPGRAIDLTTAWDRILGVLIGITVMGSVDVLLWPNFAGAALGLRLTETARALAVVQRHIAKEEWSEAGVAALAVHGQIAAALALYDEAQMESGWRGAISESDRSRSLAVVNGLQQAFLELLVVRRHRRGIRCETLPLSLKQKLQALDEGIARRFEALAEAPAGPVADPEILMNELLSGFDSSPASDGIDEMTRRQLTEYTASVKGLVEAMKRV
jgi:multidrug resistance protein MdtO